ncbi:MAG TPA: glucoamylase family protein [Gemmatimonadales bacterium]|nr:glucoamylase family protein [Gemmatimonadales bacterium]
MARHRSLALVLFAAVGCRATVPAPVSAPSPPAVGKYAPSARETAFLDTLQRRTFDFFWERTNPRNGLTPDRWPTKSFSSIAAVGFALSAYPIGVERRYISRAAARDRVLTTLKFFWQAPQGQAAASTTGYKGFFYHFLDLETGRRFEQVELSTIDTTLLLGGVLFCQMYFDGNDLSEAAIRAYADSLYQRVDWRWAQTRGPLVSMGWRPGSGFIDADWHGLNEAILLLVLALGSPTHPVDTTAWIAWTSTYQWGTFYGQEHVGFAPLFGHQYSHAFIDFRGIRDSYMKRRGIDYFENSRRATYAQRDYAVANPEKWTGYGADAWGLTASDGPADTTLVIGGRIRRFMEYAARGASFEEVRDDGTIAPTGVGGSLPFAPEIVLPALIRMREKHGDALFGRYGFLDAFNETFPGDQEAGMARALPGRGWYDTDYLGIDQGPILVMAENYRTGLVWRYIRKHPAIIRGLRRAGFTGGWLDQAPATQ